MHTFQSLPLVAFYFYLYDKVFLTSFESEAVQPLAGCKGVKTALSLCRFWLQFSTEDGPGPGSAISLDNISFSMDCFLACEYNMKMKMLTLAFYMLTSPDFV